MYSVLFKYIKFKKLPFSHKTFGFSSHFTTIVMNLDVKNYYIKLLNNSINVFYK